MSVEQVELFAALQRVLATPEERRTALIDELPGLDPYQRQRLRQMLKLAEQDARRESRRGARRSARDAAAQATASASPSDGDSPPGEGLLRALKPGAVLGDFELWRSLGEGGMGQVWEAHQISVGRSVGLKLLKSGLLHGEDALTRLRREAHTAGGLQHPGLITVHAAGEVEGVPFVAMELIPGGRTLNSWVREHDAQGPSATHARAAAALMAQIADAVQAAHEAGVVHRDLKPANVMLREDGSPVVVDFGLAGVEGQPAGEVTELRIVSPAYQAPEQISQRATGKDPRTDVYQLGVTLYELVTLRRAFGDSSRLALERRIAAGDFPRPRAVAKGVPWELEAIVLRAMERDPARRYRSAGALRDDLRRFVAGVQLPEAARGGRARVALRRVPYLARRHRVASMVVGALLLGGIVVGAVKVMGGGASLRAFKLDGGMQGRAVAFSSDETAREGDVLGVELTLGQPATVYALSAFGERSPPSWVMTREPLTVAMLKSETEFELTRGLSLAPGQHELVFTVLAREEGASRYPDPRVPYEGLIVFVADAPNAILDDWLDRVARGGRSSLAIRADSGQSEGLSYAAALKRLEDVDAPMRGKELKFSDADRSHLADLRGADWLDADELQLPGVRVRRIMWEVVGD